VPTINFGGLATGIDTEALIKGLMAAERQPLNRLQAQKSTLDSARTTITSISTKLAALKTAARAMETPSGYASFKASSTDAAVVARAAGGASPGSYDVTVQALARASKHYSAAQTTSTDPLGLSGPLTLQIGSGAALDIDVTAGDSLADVASKINASGQRASASILFDGTGYRLQVRGLDTGAASGVTLGGAAATGLGLDVPAARVQSAQDAALTIDGIAVTRSTNQVSGVIPGVTLALTRTTASPATVAIESDGDNAKSKLKAFVSAYNDVVSASRFAAGWGSIKASNSELSADSTIRSVLDRLGRTVGEPVAGATGRYQTLASIGVRSNKDGALELDEVALDKAMLADSTAVTRLIVSDSGAGTTGAMSKVSTLVEQLATNANAPLLKKIEAFGVRMKRIDNDSDAQARRLTIMEAQLRARFTQLEMLVSKINSQGSALAGISNNNK